MSTPDITAALAVLREMRVKITAHGEHGWKDYLEPDIFTASLLYVDRAIALLDPPPPIAFALNSCGEIGNKAAGWYDTDVIGAVDFQVVNTHLALIRRVLLTKDGQ